MKIESSGNLVFATVLVGTFFTGDFILGQFWVELRKKISSFDCGVDCP